jgi:hypothetical protein
MYRCSVCVLKQNKISKKTKKNNGRVCVRLVRSVTVRLYCLIRFCRLLKILFRILVEGKMGPGGEAHRNELVYVG